MSLLTSPAPSSVTHQTGQVTLPCPEALLLFGNAGLVSFSEVLSSCFEGCDDLCCTLTLVNSTPCCSVCVPSYVIRPPEEELSILLLDPTKHPQTPLSICPQTWRQQELWTSPAVCLLIDASVTAPCSPCEAQHSERAFELLSESARLQDGLISAVNHCHKRAQQDSWFNKLKEKKKCCACLGRADKAV